MEIYKKILYLLSPNERKQSIVLILMFLFMALLDMIGVASIMPFIYVLSNPDIIETNSTINFAFQASKLIGVETDKQFLEMFDTNEMWKRQFVKTTRLKILDTSIHIGPCGGLSLIHI